MLRLLLLFDGLLDKGVPASKCTCKILNILKILNHNVISLQTSNSVDKRHITFSIP